jgi:hypothetical protein
MRRLRSRALIVLLLLAFILLLSVARFAHAHSGGDPHVIPVLDEVPSELDGVSVQTAFSVAPQLVLTNPTDAPVEVLSPERTPFLRVGPNGVEGNVNARDWYTTNDPFGAKPIPEHLRAGDGTPEARWERVSREPSWGWFDQRISPRAIVVSPKTIAAGGPATLRTWTVPVRYRGKVVELKGRIVYRPLRGGFRYGLAGGEQTATPVPGVSVSILEGAGVPGVFLTNTTDREVVVVGKDGEPFLRFSSKGVEANALSPSWVQAQRIRGEASPDAATDAKALPRWQLETPQQAFGWLEPRGSFGADEPGLEIVRLGVPVDVRRWEIPLDVGGQRHVVQAVTQWVPIADVAGLADQTATSSKGSGILRGGLAALALVALVTVEITRKRRRPQPRTEVQPRHKVGAGSH